MGIFSQLPSDPAVAIPILQQLLNEHPHVAELHFELGDRFAQVSKDMHDDRALDSWQRALELKPDWPSVYPDWTRALRMLAGRVIHKQHDRPRGREIVRDLLQIERQIARSHPLGGAGVRILSNYNVPYHLGHLALEPDLLIKMQRLGWRELEKYVLVVERAPTNQCLLDYWRPFIQIVQEEQHVKEMLPLRKWLHLDTFYMTMPDGRVLNSLEAMVPVQKEWEQQGRQPLLSLTVDHYERGWDALAQVGIPKGSWFVCVHAREAGFYNDAQSQTGMYRNVDVSSYALAIDRIVDRGGWVVRVGESTVKPLPKKERTFDYARSSLKSDWMDVFLGAQCRFFLGSTSGFMNVPSVFGRPCALTNWSIFHSLPCFAHDRFILKHPYWKDGRRPVSWRDMCRPPIAVSMDDELDALGFAMESNSPEDIADLAVEMMDTLDGTFAPSDEDVRLQGEVRRLFDSEYSTGSPCRMGASFLRKYGHMYL